MLPNQLANSNVRPPLLARVLFIDGNVKKIGKRLTFFKTAWIIVDHDDSAEILCCFLVFMKLNIVNLSLFASCSPQKRPNKHRSTKINGSGVTIFLVVKQEKIQNINIVPKI